MRSAHRRDAVFNERRRRLYRPLRHVDTFSAHSQGRKSLAFLSQSNHGEVSKLTHDVDLHRQTGQRVEILMGKTRNVISDGDQSRRDQVNGA